MLIHEEGERQRRCQGVAMVQMMCPVGGIDIAQMDSIGGEEGAIQAVRRGRIPWLVIRWLKQHLYDAKSPIRYTCLIEPQEYPLASGGRVLIPLAEKRGVAIRFGEGRRSSAEERLMPINNGHGLRLS
jgi:hypothetical protein